MLSQTSGILRPDVYLTTQVRPLAVNGVPLAQLVELTGQMVGTPPPDQIPSLQDDLRQLIEKFTGIQGYDLAHGPFPDFTGFEAGFGSSGPGPNEILGPPGRLLDAHDANSANVLIPLDPVPKSPACSASYHPVKATDKYLCDNYTTYNGDTISVQSLVTGQILNLRVVGQYTPEDGEVAPLFGKILADDSVVRALSDGQPSYAYGLRLDTTQRQTVFERLRKVVPAVQVYDFTTGLSGPETKPVYSILTDLNTEEGIWSFDHPLLLGEAAISWALLAAIIIVASWEARALLKRRRELRGEAGGGRAPPHER